MTTDSMIEVEMPRQFERLQNTVIEAIIESSARITHGRRITLELRNFTILKQLLKRRKIKGLSVKTNWFKIGAGRFRMVVYPKGDSRSQSHLSFFIQKEKSAAGSCMCFLWYTLSISGISDLSRSSTGRFANTDEELGWSEFVDLGVLLDIYRGYIVDDIITFHADVHVLGEDFYRGNAELRLRGFDVDPKVEGEPTIWVIANFSAFLDVMATSIIVGPSFKFGKLALHVVIMIKGEYLYGRLDCDASSLTDYEKNVEISYSMGFYVHGEGRRKLKYRYSKLLLQSMNDDGVSLKKVSEMPATRNEYGVTVSCRILGLLRICEGIPIQEQAEETASHENNSDIVAWYPPPIYSLTSSSIHGDVSASTPHLSGASTASAVLPGPNTVRGFGHAKAEVTQQRTLSDDSTTDHTSTTGLGKNLIDDHDLKASFALDTLEPAQVPRDIDLSPGQPLQSNQPSGSLGVIGGRSISDLGAFSDNIGGSSANSGGMHDQVHNLQMLNASLDMPATVLQPMAPTMKGEKQKGENTQGSEMSSPSPGAFNLTDFSCELGVGSTIASLETAIPQIMAMQEMLNQSMNLEIDMQKQLMTMVSAPAEDSRRLEIVGERMDKLLKANTDALWDRIQKETGKREKLVREHTEQMTSLITNFINKDLPAWVEKTVKKEFTAIEKAVSVAIEKAVSVAIAEAFQKEVGSKAINQLEKSVNLKLEATVARQIQAQLQTSGKQALQETLKSSLEGPVIRAFEMSCKALFEKVDTTFQKEMIDHATVAQQQFESTHSPLALALRDTVNSASSLTQTLSGELYDGQRKLLALAATGANSNKIEAPLDLTKELSRLVSERKYEEAFATALQRLDVSIVSWLCYQVDLHCILAMVPLPLSQVVLLFLLQQLACDISKDTTEKLAWMTGVAVAFNPSDPMIAVYVRSILEDVYGKLNHYRSLPTASSTERSNICLLMHVIKSMLMSDFFSIFRPLLFFLDR